MENLSLDTKKPIKIGLMVLTFGLFTFMGWAMLAPLDEGVPASGTLVVQSKRKTISHLSGGIIREIFVTEAQKVKVNEILVLLDDTIAKSNYETTLQNSLQTKANLARLISERNGDKEIKFPASLNSSEHPTAEQYKKIQQNVFRSRQRALSSELAVFEASAVSEEMNAETLEKQILLFERELASIRALADEEYAPRNQILQMERQILQTAAQAQKSKRNALENRAKIAQRKLAYSKDIDTEIADTQKEADSLEEKLAALKEELERSRVTSPVDGYVTDLSVSTIGGIVTPGMRLMDIIPQDEKLVFETQIPPNLIERVFPGLEARIQLHNFPETPQLNIQGKVLSVSADLVPNKIPNQPPYYLARVEITPDGFIELGNKRLQPGMQAEILIKTGERTFITYLLKPIYRRLSSALKE